MSDLAIWLSGLHANSLKGTDSSALILQLRHCRLEQPTALVDRFRFERNADANALAEEIEDRAQDDASVLGSAQVYAVIAIDGEEQIGLRRFRVGVTPTNGGELGLTEPASSVGMLALVMRHLEATQQLLVRTVHSSQSFTNRELERANGRIESLEDRNERLHTLDEKRAGKRAKRERKALLDKAKADGFSKLVGAAQMLAPMALSAALGNKDKKSNKLDDLSFAAMLESLDETQKQDILKILRPEQLAVFASMAAKYGDSFAVGGDEDELDDEDDETEKEG